MAGIWGSGTGLELANTQPVSQSAGALGLRNMALVFWRLLSDAMAQLDARVVIRRVSAQSFSRAAAPSSHPVVWAARKGFHTHGRRTFQTNVKRPSRPLKAEPPMFGLHHPGESVCLQEAIVHSSRRCWVKWFDQSKWVTFFFVVVENPNGQYVVAHRSSRSSLLG